MTLTCMRTCFVLALYDPQMAMTEDHPEYCLCVRMYSFTGKYLLTWCEFFLGQFVNFPDLSCFGCSGRWSESEDVTEQVDCEYLVVDMSLGAKDVLKQNVFSYKGWKYPLPYICPSHRQDCV